MAASDYVDEAVEVLGGENSDFMLTARDAGEVPGTACAQIVMECRLSGCEWGQSVGQMELWEFISDAREHWQASHATSFPEPEDDDGEPDGVVRVG